MKMNTQVNDNVNAPKHYCSHPSGIECIQIAELLPFNLGNAIKYLWRSDLKWDKQEDTKKAIFYLRRQAALGKLPTYTNEEHTALKEMIWEIHNSDDYVLWEICETVVFGDADCWMDLAMCLENGYAQ
jgi:hypothetical protein